MESIAPRLGRGLCAGSDEHAGRLFPQPELADGRLMDDRCGYAPALLVDDELLKASGITHQVLSDLGVCLLASNREPKVRRCLEQFGTKAVLVRPDRYVLGTARTKAELSALIDGIEPFPLVSSPGMNNKRGNEN